ncbi:MAG TPA: gephyrin-like molybdotransferase Glp [Granulicella sp.]|nr:gephyrin-like molybdotransferase Glp [Granulicella sp.]
MRETPEQQSQGRVVGFAEALATVLQHATSLRGAAGDSAHTERVELMEALGRVLAAPILADRDQPPFDRATRDGFAVRAEEISQDAWLRVVGQVRAGERWTGATMDAGEAIEIMTGAPVPEGADAVVMVEHVELAEGQVRLLAGRTLRAGENIVVRGKEARAGAVVVPEGTQIGAAEIALAASCGQAELAVRRRPRVSITATGDELVGIGETPESHQIRNSNSYGMAALVTAAGGEAGRLEVARDLREEVWERVAQGRMWDLMLLSGGVSMGKYDLVEEVLAEFGAEFFFTGVKMQPGKPVVFGRLPRRESGSGAGPECYFFGLPGNPVSTQVTFHCFVEPLLRALGGGEVAGPHFVQATLVGAATGRPGLTRVLPARLTSDLERPTVRMVEWQGSGDLAANARANCYAVLPEGQERFAEGDAITVLQR